jgi:hypothetical protein
VKVVVGGIRTFAARLTSGQRGTSARMDISPTLKKGP